MWVSITLDNGVEDSMLVERFLRDILITFKTDLDRAVLFVHVTF